MKNILTVVLNSKHEKVCCNCSMLATHTIIVIPLTFSNSIQSNRLYGKHNNDVNIYLEDTQCGGMKSKLKSNGVRWYDLLLSTRVAVIFRLMSKCCFLLLLTLNHLLWLTRVLSFKHFISKYFQTDRNHREI